MLHSLTHERKASSSGLQLTEKLRSDSQIHLLVEDSDYVYSAATGTHRSARRGGPAGRT